MTKEKKEPELIDAPPAKKLERFDNLFRGVLSVSNKTVRGRMEAEKRKRARRRRGRKRAKE